MAPLVPKALIRFAKESLGETITDLYNALPENDSKAKRKIVNALFDRYVLSTEIKADEEEAFLSKLTEPYKLSKPLVTSLKLLHHLYIDPNSANILKITDCKIVEQFRQQMLIAYGYERKSKKQEVSEKILPAIQANAGSANAAVALESPAAAEIPAAVASVPKAPLYEPRHFDHLPKKELEREEKGALGLSASVIEDAVQAYLSSDYGSIAYAALKAALTTGLDEKIARMLVRYFEAPVRLKTSAELVSWLVDFPHPERVHGRLSRNPQTIKEFLAIYQSVKKAASTLTDEQMQAALQAYLEGNKSPPNFQLLLIAIAARIDAEPEIAKKLIQFYDPPNAHDASELLVFLQRLPNEAGTAAWLTQDATTIMQLLEDYQGVKTGKIVVQARQLQDQVGFEEYLSGRRSIWDYRILKVGICDRLSAILSKLIDHYKAPKHTEDIHSFLVWLEENGQFSQEPTTIKQFLETAQRLRSQRDQGSLTTDK